MSWTTPLQDAGADLSHRFHTRLESRSRRAAAASPLVAHLNWRTRRGVAKLRDLRPTLTIARFGIASIGYGLAARWGRVRKHERRIIRSEKASEEMLQAMQRMYFDAPWLSRATWRAGMRLAATATASVRTILRVRRALGWISPEAAAAQIERLPDDGFSAFFGSYLLWCEAAGYLRGGPVSVRAAVVDGHGECAYTRREVPASIAQSIKDIDELYWTGEAGALVKIVRVGAVPGRIAGRVYSAWQRVAGRSSRWIVTLAGTDHMWPASTQNPADTQTNLYESLGYPSAMRLGVLRAILDAFERAGINTPDQRLQQSVLFVGHSQGAMIAAALAADPQVPFRTSAIVSAGGPIGGIPVPPEVDVLSLRHIQDTVPAIDDAYTPGNRHAVVCQFSVDPPAEDVLYYAHAAGTYARTAEVVTANAKLLPDSPLGRVMSRIEQFYPRLARLGIAEPGRVFIYEISQDYAALGAELTDYTEEYEAVCRAASQPVAEEGADVSP